MYLSSISSRLFLYDTNSWDLQQSYGCHDGILRDVSWSDDSEYILQVNSKGAVDILSPAKHDLRSVQHIPLKDTWSASFHRDGHRNVAIGTKSGTVLMWDTKNKNVTKTFPTPNEPSRVNFISFNAKNTALAATMLNGDTVIYGLVSNIPVMTVNFTCSRNISAMKFHHETRSLLGLATDEGNVIIRDITTNKDKSYFKNIHASPVSDIAFSLINKDVLLSCGYDKVIHVYDMRMQNVVSTIKTSHALTSLTINLENQVALGTKDGYILIYDLRDLNEPFKILQGHEEEVRKVAFQPTRKKTVSANISLREDVEVGFTLKTNSPVKTRTSDVYFANETPPKNTVEVSGPVMDSREDSFLAMMDLDTSNVGFENEANKSSEYERGIDRHEMRYRQVDAEKNVSKASTPLTSRMADNLLSSACTIPNAMMDESRNFKVNVGNVKQSNVTEGNLNTETIAELKEFIEMKLFDVASDNRNHYLQVMMELTKQKLFLEKQLSAMNGLLHNSIQNQNMMAETNRMLALEISHLKAQQNPF